MLHEHRHCGVMQVVERGYLAQSRGLQRAALLRHQASLLQLLEHATHQTVHVHVEPFSRGLPPLRSTTD